MSNKRKSISKKLRFEVFKRDSFTCQYCGRMAPDVLLEIDHINPVKNGGDNDILNLITSCQDCNRGKGAKTLSKNDLLNKQRAQLKELNEKRDQMKLMIEWKEELENFENEQVKEIEAILETTFTEYGSQNIKKHIKRFGFNEVYDSTKISFSQYYEEDDPKSIEKVVNYIPKICGVRSKSKSNPMVNEHYYIRAILRNRSMLYNEKRVWNFLNGVCLDQDECELVKDLAKTCRNWTEFWKEVNEVYGGDW